MQSSEIENSLFEEMKRRSGQLEHNDQGQSMCDEREVVKDKRVQGPVC